MKNATRPAAPANRPVPQHAPSRAPAGFLALTLLLAGCAPGTWERVRADEPPVSDELVCERVHVGLGKWVKVIQWKFTDTVNHRHVAGDVVAFVDAAGNLVWFGESPK